MTQQKKPEVKHQKSSRKPASKFGVGYFRTQAKAWWRAKFWHKLVAGFLALIFLSIVFMYSIAQWYIHEHAREPFQLGATFISDYAKYFGLDPHETLHAMFDDMGVRNVRFVSYWEDIERSPGQYDFTNLDWQFAMAAQYHARVSLSIGLRQPRWPECHMPEWAQEIPKSQWEPRLMEFITAVVQRYQINPQLDSYQLENEYLLKVFGECKDFDRQRLVDEFNLVKKLDPDHTLIISMSNNAIGTPIGQPTPDEWAISVYKRVWDKTITKRYFEYPIPAWYYAFRAGFTEITRGRDSFIHELQTEAWPAADQGIKDASIAEQNKSLDGNRLADRIKYGEATGMRKVDVWGVEWWYWRKVKKNDPSLWDAGKAAFARVKEENKKLDY